MTRRTVLTPEMEKLKLAFMTRMKRQDYERKKNKELVSKAIAEELERANAMLYKKVDIRKEVK